MALSLPGRGRVRVDMPLCGSYCSICGDTFVPVRSACPRCGSTDLTEQALSGKGDVYSYTVVRAQPERVVAVVHLAEGAYVTAPLEDVAPATVFIGMPVEVVDHCEPLTFRLRRCLTE